MQVAIALEDGYKHVGALVVKNLKMKIGWLMDSQWSYDMFPGMEYIEAPYM